MTAIGYIAAVAMCGATVRAWVAHRQERRFMREYVRRPDGVIVGAEPLSMEGQRAGAILLLHGYNDSPQSLRSVALALHARGWTVCVPLLPGHGRTLQDFAQSGAAAWLDAARRAYEDLRGDHDAVAVGGLSMGGALAFILAAEHPEIRAVVNFAPYLFEPVGARVFRLLAPVVSLATRYLWGGGRRSVHDPDAAKAMIAYRRSTPRLLVQLAQVARMARLSIVRVRQPVLIMQSREDNRIPEASALDTFAALPATDKTLHWVADSGHVITVDYGHEAVEQFAADWLEPRLA